MSAPTRNGQRRSLPLAVAGNSAGTLGRSMARCRLGPVSPGELAVRKAPDRQPTGLPSVGQRRTQRPTAISSAPMRRDDGKAHGPGRLRENACAPAGKARPGPYGAGGMVPTGRTAAIRTAEPNRYGGYGRYGGYDGRSLPVATGAEPGSLDRLSVRRAIAGWPPLGAAPGASEATDADRWRAVVVALGPDGMGVPARAGHGPPKPGSSRQPVPRCRPCRQIRRRRPPGDRWCAASGWWRAIAGPGWPVDRIEIYGLKTLSLAARFVAARAYIATAELLAIRSSEDKECGSWHR